MVAGKTAFVTGGASGIGRAIAERFVAEGARGVMIADVDDAALADVVAALSTPKCEVRARQLDVTDPDAVTAAVADAIQQWGRLDCAVNNAGVSGPIRPLDEYDVAEWRQVMGINLDGVFFCMHAELRAMLSAGSGAIVNISSGAAIHPPPGLAPYAASKAALVGLTRAVAGDYARRGIRVNCVLPGPTSTPLWESNLGDDPAATRRAIEKRAPMGRIGNAAEIAEAVVWLCSDRASYVQGVDLLVDGGLHAFASS